LVTRVPVIGEWQRGDLVGESDVDYWRSRRHDPPAQDALTREVVGDGIVLGEGDDHLGHSSPKPSRTSSVPRRVSSTTWSKPTSCVVSSQPASWRMSATASASARSPPSPMTELATRRMLPPAGCAPSRICDRSALR
jgi:hypothetical protein